MRKRHGSGEAERDGRSVERGSAKDVPCETGRSKSSDERFGTQTQVQGGKHERRATLSERQHTKCSHNHEAMVCMSSTAQESAHEARGARNETGRLGR